MSISVRVVAVAIALALVAAACSDAAPAGESSPPVEEPQEGEPATVDADLAPPDGDTNDAPESEPVPAPDDSLIEPEFIELTYFEMTERATFEGELAEECEDVDDEIRVCGGGSVRFDSTSNLLGRARDESVLETTSYATACPGSGSPGTERVLDGTITSQWGDEVFFTYFGHCGPESKYWVVTGGTGRFEGASGVMSNAGAWADSPFVGFGTGQLRVRAELWEDWLPPAPETLPNPEVEYLAVPYFEGFLSNESTVEPIEDCDSSDPEMIVCETTTSGVLRGTLLGDATESATGTWTQLLTDTCELDDGSTAIPIMSETEGTITSQLGDELFFVARTRVDPCATLGSGSFLPAFHWRVTGGTGRFEGAHGLMSGVTTPDLGFEAISTGTLHVRADRWPQLAQEYANLPSGDDYIELRYFERFLLAADGLPGFKVEPVAECDTTEPGVEICDYEITGNLTGTHIGAASEIQTGTITRRLDETCPTGGVPSLRLGTGVITTPWGDDLQFRNVADSCDIAYWVLDGGTGRFEDAGGVMTGLGAFEFGGDTVLLQIGRFHLRGDLWEDLIPRPD